MCSLFARQRTFNWCACGDLVHSHHAPEHRRRLPLPASMAQTFRVKGTRTNIAHIRQSRPDSGRGVQVKFLSTFVVFPSSLSSGVCGDLVDPHDAPEHRRRLPPLRRRRPSYLLFCPFLPEIL